MAAITDPGSVMAAITYPPGSVIDGIGYRVTVPLEQIISSVGLASITSFAAHFCALAKLSATCL